MTEDPCPKSDVGHCWHYTAGWSRGFASERSYRCCFCADEKVIELAERHITHGPHRAEGVTVGEAR